MHSKFFLGIDYCHVHLCELQLAEEYRIKQIAVSWINITDEYDIVIQFQSHLPAHKWKLCLIYYFYLIIYYHYYFVCGWNKTYQGDIKN